MCFNHVPSWAMLHVLQELLPSFRYCTDLSTHPLDVLFKHIPSWAISFTYPLELSHPHSLLSYRIRALSHLRDLSLEPLNHLLLPLTTHHVILSTYPPTLLSLVGWDMVTKKCIGSPPLSPGNPFLSNLFYAPRTSCRLLPSSNAYLHVLIHSSFSPPLPSSSLPPRPLPPVGMVTVGWCCIMTPTI